MKKLICTTLLSLAMAPFAMAQDYSTQAQSQAEIQTQNQTSEQNQTLETPPMYGRGVICYANNPYGRYFSAWGPNPYIGQRRAMDYCFQYSELCRPDGCQPY